MNRQQYAYCVIAPKYLGAKLQEAWERGWRVHTFTERRNEDGVADDHPSVLFEWRDVVGQEWKPPLQGEEGT